MNMHATILLKTLRDEHTDWWLSAWTPAVIERLAQWAYDQVDFGTGGIRSDFDRLDNPIDRSAIVPSDATTLSSCAERLLTHRTYFNHLFQDGGLGTQTRVRIRRLLVEQGVVSELLAIPGSRAVFSSIALQDVWCALANRIAVRLHEDETRGCDRPEWLVLNHLLLASYFQGCRLEKAALVRQGLSNLSVSLHGPRGGLLRIVEKVTKTGMVDPLPPFSPPGDPAALATASASLLVDAVAEESMRMNCGQGIMHRFLAGAAPPEVPAAARSSITHDQLVRLRDGAYRQYEATLVAYSALAAIEQLLHTWAQHCGVNHMLEAARPKPVSLWLKHLPCSAILRDRIEQLYDTDSFNLRNRVMHCGLLEVESKRTEWLLAVTDTSDATSLTRTARLDPLIPENLTRLCLAHLKALDEEVAGIGLAAEDFSWTRNMWLTAEEVRLGAQLHCDLLDSRSESERWRLLFQRYVRASLPSLSIHSQLAFVGWIKDVSARERPIMMMAWGVFFEALYRLTAYLYGFEVVQRSPRGADQYMFQYRMLAHWSGGLCRPEVLAAVLRFINEDDRPVAKKTLLLAVKVRDALSHGAMLGLDEETHMAVGHLFVKSIQTLITSAIHRMTQVNAYYRWHSHRDSPEEGELADWLHAERAVLQMFADPG